MTLNPTFLPQSLISRLTMILIPLINYNIKNRQPTTLLFSGGLDSSLLAGICAHILEGEIIREKKEKKDQNEQIQNENEICIGGAGSIELINVAFGPPFTTPDRSSSLLSLLNLTLNFPFVHFFLFLNDISNQQIKPMKQRLERAMWPRNTVMDIGLAVTAFAGLVECQLGRNGFEEQIQQNEKNQSSKIAISGLGPDEMAGGYRHHHRKYEISKQKTIVQLMKAREQKVIVLSDEEIMQQAEDAAISSSSSSMLFDMGRIWYRNNARDSRTADAASNYSAYLIGLDYSASQPKTAMQFGSRSSKLSRANGDQQISITPWAEDKMNQNIEKTGNKKKDKFKKEEQNQNIINLIQEKEQDQKEEQIKSDDGQS
ncbi:MAG: hypothetical protein EZS28_012535 [Streblomastix strix]|uniref:Asparagine synthetase domain-containing protein n=1 Tax=Streblomastix strix TaxID=222440 RepID=A0A5J4WAK2_9EUKA|nr:MAG: hypothetical protein EZS28_012535 [Streblomastix strix]